MVWEVWGRGAIAMTVKVRCADAGEEEAGGHIAGRWRVFAVRETGRGRRKERGEGCVAEVVRRA